MRCFSSKNRYFCIRYICVLVLLIGTLNCQSQEYTLSGGLSLAKVVKHKKELFYETPARSILADISASLFTQGKKPWEKYWGRPVISLSYIYLDFGDEEVLGKAHGLIPSLGFFIVRKERSHLFAQLGLGIAYLSRHYDVIENPLNNAIGSHINNATRLRVEYGQKFDDKWSLKTGLMFQHFSNGLTSSPNSGINLFGVELGIRKRIGSKKELEKEEGSIADVARKSQLGADVRLGYGLTEALIPGGPKYAINTYSLALTYRINPFQKLFFGAEYEYSHAIFDFFYQDFLAEEEARKKATKYILFLADELYFGNVALRLQTGYYLPYPEVKKDNPIYFKVNLNYHLPWKVWKVRPYFGILIKSHFAVADYIEFVSGISF